MSSKVHLPQYTLGEALILSASQRKMVAGFICIRTLYVTQCGTLGLIVLAYDNPALPNGIRRVATPSIAGNRLWTDLYLEALFEL